MATFSVMADVPNPLFNKNGNPFSGAVLKAFLPGTTTSTSIAIDSAGSSPQASITYNAQGKLEVSGNEILPYIDRKHKWGVFANAVDAAANTPFYMGPFDNVEVGSESSLYNQGDTGAVDRTVQSKLQEFVSVKDFGALGDGATDDTTAFTNATATGKAVIIPESTGAYQVTGDFSAFEFLFLGNPTTNNTTVERGVWGTAGVIISRGTNQQVFPDTGSSYSYYGQHDGVTNFWGGGTDGGLGEHAGLTIYGRTHPTTPEDIKLRSRDIRPLWYKSTTDTLGTIGTWSMETRALIDVGPFLCTALSANSTETRMRIDNADLTLGDSTSATFYEVNHRNDTLYMQWCGGTTQASGFCIRTYGGTTPGVSTDHGMIWFANNIQVFRYRNDLNDFDFKGKSISDVASMELTPVTVANLPSSPTEGMRAFVTDSTVSGSGNFGAIVAGGSAGNVPVYYDGTNWRIG